MAVDGAAMGRPALKDGLATGEGAGPGRTVSAGLLGGLIGAAAIWVFKGVRDGLGAMAYPLGTAIHVAFALAWGGPFALIWPAFRRRGVEATLVALFYAVAAWVVTHLAVAVTSSSRPDDLAPDVVIGGALSHVVLTVPLALAVKGRLG